MILGTSYNLPVHPVKAQVSLFTCAARVCVLCTLWTGKGKLFSPVAIEGSSLCFRLVHL